MLIRAARRQLARVARDALKPASTASAVSTSTASASFASRRGASTRAASASEAGSPERAALLLLPCALTGALGAWQLVRREEKIVAIDARSRALRTRVLPGDAVVGRDGIEEYATCAVAGELDLAKSVRIGPRARSVCGVTIAGHLIVTPVKLHGRAKTRGEAGTVLLLRGWAPDTWADVDARAGACVKTEAVVRTSETKGGFTPDNNPEKDTWYWLDAPAIARACGLPEDTPLIQAVRAARDDGAGSSGQADAPQYPLAVEKESLMTFPVAPEQHLGYAATWFALSACTGAMAVVRARRFVGHKI
jgi:surfeit locus 1 family protein